MNMVIRRTLFVLMCLLASSLYMYGQIAVKTNVAMDAVAIPNLGVEVGLSKKLTLDVPMYYNPWKYSDSKMLKLAMLQPELRYWLCDKFNGHFFGAHLMGGAYHTTGIDLPFSPFDDLKDFRYKGQFYGGGISYGYQFVLGRHWNLGATIGIGYAYVRYKKYEWRTITAGRESQLMLITTTPKNFLLSASDYTTYRYLLSIQLFHYAPLLTLLFQAIIINPENERRFSI